jgi:hypothetical protein
VKESPIHLVVYIGEVFKQCLVSIVSRLPYGLVVGFNLLKNPFMCMQNGIEVQIKTRENQIQILKLYYTHTLSTNFFGKKRSSVEDYFPKT